MLIVICGAPGSEYTPERRLIDTSWDTTVQHIAEGQFNDVSSVIHSAMGRDVLDIIAKQVMDIWTQNGEPLTTSQRQFIEYNVSIQAANRFAREDA